MKRLKYLPLLLILLPMLCLFVCGLSEFRLGKVRQLTSYGAHGLSHLGGDAPPGGGNCALIGQAAEGNPFSGWPTTYRQGNWNTVTSWFCDPNYFSGYTHWGIDLGRLNWDESIHGAEAVITAEDALVVRASPEGHNSGMGRNVKVQALDCQPCTLDDPNCDPVTLKTCTELDWYAFYFHLEDVSVAVGDKLERGDVVGHINSSGNSTGDHLHYQINGPEGAIDPAPSLAGSYEDGLRGEGKGQR